MGNLWSVSRDTVVALVVTALVNFAGGWIFVEYFATTKGTVDFGKTIRLGDQYVVVASVDNVGLDYLNGVYFELPVTSSPIEVTSDSPLKLESQESNFASGRRLLKLDNFAPRYSARIYFRSSVDFDSTAIRIPNSDSLGLIVKSNQRVESFGGLIWEVNRIFFIGFYIVLSIAFFLTFYFSDLKKARLIADLNNVKDQVGHWKREYESAEQQYEQDVKQIRQQIEDVGREFKVRSSADYLKYKKAQSLLRARIFDYSKELNFWRNLVKSLLLKGGGGLNPERLFDLVTRNLKTFGVKFKDEYEYEKAVKEWFEDCECKRRDLG